MGGRDVMGWDRTDEISKIFQSKSDRMNIGEMSEKCID
jgi:hypothetical protein